MNAAQHLLIACVRIYRYAISPAKIFFFGSVGQCRFSPSCSSYALEAIARHGALSGSWLALKRLGRCHPWGGCGDDPVPGKSKGQSLKAKVDITVHGLRSTVHSPRSTVHRPESTVHSPESTVRGLGFSVVSHG